MALNIAEALYKSTGSTTSRSLGARAADIINVKDYGATGNGSTNDTVAIQNAFYAAFGNPPNANTNRFKNIPVFFPAGNYVIRSTLLLTGVDGGWIFGNGMESTTITFHSGTVSPINGQLPLFMTNGFGNVKFEGMTLIGDGVTNTVGIYIYEDGSNSVVTTANVWQDLLVNNFYTGILGGYLSFGNCDNQLFINCTYTNCALAGLRTVGFNVLNYGVYGGGASLCGSASTGPSGNCGAGYSIVTGSISPFLNLSMSLNTWDICAAGTTPLTIIGGSSESKQCLGLSATQAHLSSFSYRDTGTNASGSLFVDVSAGAYAVLTSCMYAPNNTISGTIGALGNSGILLTDNLVYNTQVSSGAVFTGTAGSKLYLRGNSYGVGANVTSGFTGTIGQNI